MTGADASELRDTLFVEPGRGNPPIDRLEFATSEVVSTTQTTDSMQIENRSSDEGVLVIGSA